MAGELSKKALECRYLFAFRCRCTDFPDGIIECEREKPDFVVVGRERIGIEITQAFTGPGEAVSSPQSVEASMDEIVDLAKKYHADSFRSTINISLHFSIFKAVDRRNRHDFAKLIAEMAERTDSGEIHCELDKFGSVLIRVFRAPWLTRSSWVRPDAGYVLTAAIDTLRSIIDNKNIKLSEYQEGIDRCWLLIIAPSHRPSGFVEPDRQSLEQTYVSKFARTYFLDYGRGKLFRVRTNVPDTQST
jgi:hypothetical protein